MCFAFTQLHCSYNLCAHIRTYVVHFPVALPKAAMKVHWGLVLVMIIWSSVDCGEWIGEQ